MKQFKVTRQNFKQVTEELLADAGKINTVLKEAMEIWLYAVTTNKTSCSKQEYENQYYYRNLEIPKDLEPRYQAIKEFIEDEYNNLTFFYSNW